MFPLSNYNLRPNIETADDLLDSMFNKEESQIMAKFINESINFAEKLDKTKVSIKKYTRTINTMTLTKSITVSLKGFPFNTPKS